MNIKALLTLLFVTGCLQAAQQFDTFLTHVKNGQKSMDECTAYLNNLEDTIDDLDKKLTDLQKWVITNRDKEKPVAQALSILRKLNALRKKKLTYPELNLLEKGESYLGFVVRAALFEQKRASTIAANSRLLENFLSKEQELKDTNILSANITIKDVFYDALNIEGRHILTDIRSLKLFPNINQVRELVAAPEIGEINENDELSEEQLKTFVMQVIQHANNYEIEFPTYVLFFSGLDADLVYLENENKCLGTWLDEKNSAAQAEIKAHRENEQAKNDAKFWEALCNSASIKRSKNSSWVTASTDQNYFGFITTVFKFLQTGSENTLNNLKNYKLESQNFQVPSIAYNDKNRSIEEILCRILIPRRGVYSSRAEKILDVIDPEKNHRKSYQNGISDNDYGKQVTGELFVSLLQEERYKHLAERYYNRYGVDLTNITYKHTTLAEYLKKNRFDPGCMRITAITNPVNPYENSWSTQEKAIAWTLLAGISYLLYSTYSQAQDDADTTATV